MFVHADFMHLLFNMIALIIFGSYLERLIGPWRMVASFFMCGFMANVLALVYASSSGQIASYVAVGASGAILGLLGNCGVIMYKVWKVYRSLVAKRFFTQVVVILCLQLTVDLIVVQSSMIHHVIGAVTGALIGHYMVRFRSNIRPL